MGRHVRVILPTPVNDIRFWWQALQDVKAVGGTEAGIRAQIDRLLDEALEERSR